MRDNKIAHVVREFCVEITGFRSEVTGRDEYCASAIGERHIGAEISGKHTIQEKTGVGGL